ncbi:MAG: teichoic acid D-Ala incorporation-associated protein DltX [Clostridiales Family XIII bacterium]|nr:teichoic acid D-Ala incorporation-associated protein DltX [Clostridiales Family XIII bacterium]
MKTLTKTRERQGLPSGSIGRLFARSIFYFAILMALIYLYHYNRVGDATFIYNEF